MKERSFQRLLSCLLAFVLTFLPVLSGLPAMQVKAAEPSIWYHVESGSENGTNHADASSAAVLLHQSAKMSEDGGTFSLTFKRQDASADFDLGFFHTYVDGSNWLYVGYDQGHGWYYRYMLNGELKGNQYAADRKASMGALSRPVEGAYVTFSAALSRETLVVKVDDSKTAVTNQDFITLAGKGGGNASFGFRAGGGAAFRFKEAKLNNQPLSSEWDFVTSAAGQGKGEEMVPVYDVTGIVQEAGSGAKIADATVRIGLDFVKTASDGSFSLAVEDGSYDVVVSAKGYVAQVVSGVTVSGSAVALPNAVALEKKASVTYENWISNGAIKAAVSKTFPQVFQYKVTVDGTEKTVDAQEKALSVMQINGGEITPTVDDVKFNADSALYSMTLKDEKRSIDMRMTVKISVSGNYLTWEVTKIEKSAECAKISSIDVPYLNLVTITEGQSGAQFMGATISGNVNDSGDDLRTFENGFYANASKRYAYGFLSADGVSAGVWSNSEMASDNRLVRNNGLNSMSLTSSTWFYDYNNEAGFQFSEYPTVYEGVANGVPASELPCVKVCLTGDANQDGRTDWQDGAIAYREIMNNPYGSEHTKDLVNYRISMNFSSQATNPYLKVADNIRKVYLATDGLPQAVMMKGYGSEGHDSANSEYGNIAERLGGLEDLKKLNTIAHQYNTQMGIHINAQEAYPEAQSFSDDLISGSSSKGWGWLDQSYVIDRGYDLGSGLRYKRLLQLYDQLNGTSLYANRWPGVVGTGADETVADAATIAETVAAHKGAAENLDFMYLDVWYGDSWETRKIAQQFNSLGWRFSTEFGYEGEYDSTWQHWATEGHYGGAAMKGINSDVIRFIRNHQKDSFVLNWPSYHGAADNPLLGGFDLGGFEGWGSNNNFDQYISKTFAVNLPTKFLQHYKVYRWENYEGDTSPVGNHEKQITLKSDDGAETVVVTRNETQRSDGYVERTITLNGRKVLEDVKYLLPWTDEETGEEKLYHFNYDGGASTWDLPAGWASLANVRVYELSDAGRINGRTVAATGGKITLQASPNTPYIVVKGAASAAKTVSGWSSHAHVTDTGFNSYAGTGDGDVLNGEIWSGDVTDVRVVRVASGNKYLRMGSEKEKQKVSTAITDLKPGTNYVAQVYVDNKSEAKAWIKVTGGVKAVSNYTLRSLAPNYPRCDAHNINALEGSRMQTMLVSFTAKDTTAVLTLEREAGKGVTYFDDIRIVEKTLNNLKADGSFEQDFETVVGGLYPFVMGPAQGVDDQVTHLSERHDPYTQSGWGNIILDDVIGGNWSLKHHGSNRGIIYRTIPQNLHLEAGALYEVSFDYQAGWENSYYVVTGDGDSVIGQSDWLQKTAAPAKGQKSTTERHTFTMTASGSGQSWFGIASNGVPIPDSAEKSYGQTDFILDNLKVKKIGAEISPSAVTVSSAKDPIVLTVSFEDEVNAGNAVTWSSSNEKIAHVVPNPNDSKQCSVYMVGFGDVEISAETTLNFQEITLSSTISFPEHYDLDEEEQKSPAWKAAWANTEAHDGDVAAKAIDGAAGTQWHSSWSPHYVVSESQPAVITVQIADGDDIANYNRVSILQRNNNVNGLVKKYKCVVGDSFDPQTHTVSGNVSATEVITASHTGQGETESCVLPNGAGGKYLQIQVMEGEGNFASIAEITMDRVGSNHTEEEDAYLTGNETNWANEAKTALEAALTAAKTVKDAGQGSYTEESWTAFTAAYDAAEAGKGSSDSAELIALQQALTGAQQSLLPNLAAAQENLSSQIAEANTNVGSEKGSYTDESWNAYKEAYDAANDAEGISDPAQLVRLQQALANAMKKLETAAQREQKKLAAVLEAAKELKEAGQQDYTTESWKAFADAYDAAEQGKASENAEELSRLQAKLESAQSDLLTNAQKTKMELSKLLEKAAKTIRMGQDNYSNESWGVFVKAYQSACAATSSGNVEELKSLCAALVDAESRLELKKPDEPPAPPTDVPDTMPPAPVPTETLKTGDAFVSASLKYEVTGAQTVKVTGAEDKNLKTIAIPSTVTEKGTVYSVTEIGAKAFQKFAKLKTVKIGSSVTKIGKNSFNGCKNLKKITVQGTKLSKVEKGALKGTNKKLSVTLPKKGMKAKARRNLIKQIKKAGNKKVKVK